MRIATNYFSQQSVTAMLNKQSELAKTQQQVSTGKIQSDPSDDPVAAVKVMGLQRQINLSGQYQANADVAESKLSTTDGILSSATDILQRIRELGIQGLNDTNDANSRKGIAEEISQLNEALVGLANTTDANGEYLFAGYQSGTQPFDSSSYAYNGDSGQRNIQVGAGYSVEINETGDTLFNQTTVGGSTQAIFQTIDDFAATLKDNTVGTAPNDGEFLSNMDTTMDNVSEARTRTGTRLNAIDHQRSINESTISSAQTTLSQVQDLDYAAAVTRLNLQATGLQAAQQSYVKVQGLSLFNYL